MEQIVSKERKNPKRKKQYPQYNDIKESEGEGGDPVHFESG